MIRVTLRMTKAAKMGLITTMLLTVLLMTIAQAYAQQVSSIVITIDPSGVVYVEINGTIEVGMNFFECPVEPILATVTILIDGESAPLIYYNNSFLVISNYNKPATITYIANTTYEDGRVSFYYNSTMEATLVVPPNVLLTPENLTLIDASVRDNKLFLRLRGPSTISFIVSEVVGGREPAYAPSNQTLTIILTIPVGAEIALYVSVVVIAVVGVVIAVRRRRSKILTTYLDEVDKAIIEKLRKHGGEIIQSLLYKELSLPKATIWRHVKKLEKMGYVTVERMGRDNRVRLSK